MGLELLIGAVVPLVVEFINKYVKDSKLKFGVSVLIPVILGGVTNYSSIAAGDPEQVLASGALIFASAQTVYKLYFKNSKVQKMISEK